MVLSETGFAVECLNKYSVILSLMRNPSEYNLFDINLDNVKGYVSNGIEKLRNFPKAVLLLAFAGYLASSACGGASPNSQSSSYRPAPTPQAKCVMGGSGSICRSSTGEILLSFNLTDERGNDVRNVVLGTPVFADIYLSPEWFSGSANIVYAEGRNLNLQLSHVNSTKPFATIPSGRNVKVPVNVEGSGCFNFYIVGLTDRHGDTRGVTDRVSELIQGRVPEINLKVSKTEATLSDVITIKGGIKSRLGWASNWGNFSIYSKSPLRQEFSQQIDSTDDINHIWIPPMQGEYTIKLDVHSDCEFINAEKKVTVTVR